MLIKPWLFPIAVSVFSSSSFASSCDISKISDVSSCQQVMVECDLYANDLYASKKISYATRYAYQQFFSHFSHDYLSDFSCDVEKGIGTCTINFDIGCPAANWPTQGYDVWEKAKQDLAVEVNALLSNPNAVPFNHFKGYICEHYVCHNIQQRICRDSRPPSLLGNLCKAT